MTVMTALTGPAAAAADGRPGPGVLRGAWAAPEARHAVLSPAAGRDAADRDAADRDAGQPP